MIKRSEEEKNKWVKELKQRIKSWVIRVLSLCESLPQNTTTRVINFQLIKSASSTGANHRASCRARSDKEFFAKMSIALEEADESQYWLEIIEAKQIPCNQKELQFLLKEIDEFVRIFAKARLNTKK